jgi:hypothetical protein
MVQARGVGPPLLEGREHRLRRDRQYRLAADGIEVPGGWMRGWIGPDARHIRQGSVTRLLGHI